MHFGDMLALIHKTAIGQRPFIVCPLHHKLYFGIFVKQHTGQIKMSKLIILMYPNP